MSDFYQDQGAFLVKLMHSTPVPDFVKNAEYETEEGIDALPDYAFADPISRQFPIHTPSDVYLSAAYLHGKTACDQKIDEQIKTASKVFGIEDSVNAVIELAKKRFELTSKVASPNIWDFETKSASFSGSGLEALNDAVSSFEQTRMSYEFNERTEIAENLSKIASDLGADLPESISKFAGNAHVDLEKLQAQLEVRATFLHHPRDVQEFLCKIAVLGNAAAATPEEAMKVAEFIDGFDTQHGLTKFYGSRLEDPHSSVFNTSLSEYEDKTATVKIGHVVHKLIDLRLCSEIIDEILESKVADLRSLADLDDEKARQLNQVLA